MEMIADYIIDNFHYLKPSEIKYCFRKGIFQGDTFNKLDCNIIGKWIKLYDKSRDDEMYSKTQDINKKNNDDNEKTISYDEHMAILKQKADGGDKESEEIYKSYSKIFKTSKSRENFKKNHHLKK